MTAIYNPRARQVAGAIAVVAGATLLLRIFLSYEETGGVWEAVSYLSQFFTILTNALVFAAALAVAFGAAIAPGVTKALTIAIVGVGIVYHAALAHLLDLSGMALLADHGVHTIVPAMTFIWWLFFLPKAPFQMSQIPSWVIWPLFYCGYILIRASFSGFYPYPFLNLPALGVAGLAQSIVVLCVAFIVIGLALTGLSRLVGGTQSKDQSR